MISDATPRVLTAQLRELEYGVIERKVYAQVPPKVEYSISEPGQGLRLLDDTMWVCGRKGSGKPLPEERVKA